MSRAFYTDIVEDRGGRPVFRPTITLRDPDTHALLGSVVYADATTAATLSNPFVGAADGSFSFYLDAPARVEINASWSGHQNTKTVPVVSTAVGSGSSPSLPLAETDITGLSTDLAGKAPLSHPHAQSDVTGLDTALLGKAAANHNHPTSDITSGTFVAARLGAGTPNGTKFLRDDLSWVVPSSATLSGLTDASISSLADGDVLEYSSTASKWKNYSTPVRTWEFFGGTKTGNLAAQTAVWTTARAWLVSNGGGTIQFGLGQYLNMPSLDLPPYTTIAGRGFMQSEIVADSSLAAHFILNHKSSNGTTDQNGVGCVIRDISLNCFFMGGWGTSAFDAIHFDRNPTFGTDPTIGSGSIVEPNQTVKNVIIKNPPRDGINASAMGGHFYYNVRTIGCGRYGFKPTFDSWILACSAASSLSHGFHIDNGPTRIVECVAYNSGNSAAHAAQGQGFMVDGSSGIADSVTFVQCEAQDNFGDGFKISGVPFATVALVGCLADSNSSGSVGTYPGFNIINAPYTRMTACRAVERKSDGTNSWQRNALSISGSSFCTIDLTHKAQDSGNGAATIGTPILSADTASLGCDVNINGLKGVQQPAFAASFTPDFYVGGVVQPGVLTANMTVNAPTNGPYIVGTRATFVLQQDPTGGRTITWNAIYKNTPTSVTTTSGYTIGRFMFDGTNWVGI